MRTPPKFLVAAAISSAVLGPALLYAWIVGPPQRHSGGPGDQTCARSSCHGGSPTSQGGKVDVVFPSGPTYLPGVRQTWTVVISDPAARLFSFQLSVRRNENREFGQAGRLDPLDANTFVLCDDGSARTGAGPCPGSPVEFIQPTEAGARRGVNAYTFRWTPPEDAAGEVSVYVAALGANGDLQATGDRTYTATYTLRPAEITGAPAIRDARPVLQSFDDSERLSSGTWIQLYGTNLAFTTRSWNIGDFDGREAPQELDGVRVNVHGRPAYVSYVSPTQVNVQVPDVADLGPVRVELVNDGGTSNSASVQKDKVTPAVQTNGAFISGDRRYAVAFHPDFGAYVGPPDLIPGANFRPAAPGEVIIVYAVGSGPTGVRAGRVPAAPSPLQLPYEVRIGGIAAQAIGLHPVGYLGLYQFNITVPTLGPGDYPVDLIVDGIPIAQTLYTTIGE
ncbi:MAG: IPT/TIG domain-containing protein [Bryobacteraceae bacterium]|nr:IPT/TIG domain-containing protein [Bryobacteraceae bacterium]